MIGKIIGTLFLIIAVFFAASWLFEDKTPIQVLKDLGAISHQRGEEHQAPQAYTYHYHVKAEGLKPLDYTVLVKIEKTGPKTICFNYQIASITSGGRENATSFMHGLMGGHGEGETICTTTDPSTYNPEYYFTSPTMTGKARLAYGEHGELRGEAVVEKGILQEMKLTGKIGNRNVELHVELELH